MSNTNLHHIRVGMGLNDANIMLLQKIIDDIASGEVVVDQNGVVNFDWYRREYNYLVHFIALVEVILGYMEGIDKEVTIYNG